MIYTLNGTLLSELCQSANLALTNQGVDTLRLSQVPATASSAPDFAYGDEIALAQGSLVRFRGWVSVPQEDDFSGDALTRSVVVQGPWEWWLEGLMFLQQWNGADATYTKTKAVLFQAPPGPPSLSYQAPVPQSISATLREILQSAIDQGAAIQIGTLPSSTVDFSPPYAEVQDVTCGQAIRQVLRWLPDAACWWDYSTNPPTFHCQARRDLTELVLPVDSCQSLRPSPRRELQVPGVRIYYEQALDITAGDQSVTVTGTTIRSAGDPSQRGSLHLTVNLDGGAVEHLSQWVRTSATLIAPNNEEFWKLHNPTLKQADSVSDILVTGGQIVDAETGEPVPTYAYEIIEGGIPDWLTETAPETPRAREVIAKCRCWVRVELSDAGGGCGAGTKKRGYKQEKQRLEYRALATTSAYNYPLGHTFRRSRMTRQPESIPVGVEGSIYKALSQLHWQGSFSTVGQSPTWGIRPGVCLSWTGGASELASARAQVQQVSHSLADGRTEVQFGPPEHLAPADLLSLARANRPTRVQSAHERANGGAGSTQSSTAATQGKAAAAERAPQEMAPAPASQTWQSDDATGGHACSSVTIDPNHLAEIADPPISAPAEVKLRRVYLVVDGVPSFAAVLSSEPEPVPEV